MMRISGAQFPFSRHWIPAYHGSLVKKNTFGSCSFVKLVGDKSKYREDMVNCFHQSCDRCKLVANVDHKEGLTLHLQLIDPTDPVTANDLLTLINVDQVREGLASVNRKGCKYLASYPQVQKKLQEAIAGAKRNQCGTFEFGDVEEDDQ